MHDGMRQRLPRWHPSLVVTLDLLLSAPILPTRPRQAQAQHPTLGAQHYTQVTKVPLIIHLCLTVAMRNILKLTQ